MTDKAYNDCVRDHADGVYRFILKNLGDREDARDVVQTAFEKLWVTRETVDEIRCKSYLYTVAYHQMIDHIRKGKGQVMREEAASELAAATVPSRMFRDVLDKALARLNDTQRSLVLLKDYEGYSYEEIAEITGLTATQVKVYLHRARVQLKKFLGTPENVLEH